MPPHLTCRDGQGWTIMARDEEGWCVAIDAAHMRCSIYEARPRVCREFAMSGPCCRDARAVYHEQRRLGIPLKIY